MQLSVKGQHVDVGDALRTHVQNKLELVSSKYFNRVTDASVTFGREAQHLFTVHVTFHVGHGVKVQAAGKHTDAYIAFDEASERLAKQLRRYKNRLRDHHERLEKVPDESLLKARDYVLQAVAAPAESEHDDTPEEAHAEPVIVAEMTTHIQAMSVSEAVMRMDLADQDFMLFKNPKNGALNIVYRRPDGNIGWMDPSIEERHTKAA